MIGVESDGVEEGGAKFEETGKLLRVEPGLLDLRGLEEHEVGGEEALCNRERRSAVLCKTSCMRSVLR